MFWSRTSKANSKGFSALMVRITINKRAINFASGKQVHKSTWDKDNKKVKGNTPDAAKINMYIKKSEIKLEEIFNRLIDSGMPCSSEIVRNIFLGGGIPKETIKGLFFKHNQAFEQMIDKKGYNKKTLQKYKVFEDKLDRFLATKNRTDLFVEELDYNFISNF